MALPLQIHFQRVPTMSTCEAVQLLATFIIVTNKIIYECVLTLLLLVAFDSLVKQAMVI